MAAGDVDTALRKLHTTVPEAFEAVERGVDDLLAVSRREGIEAAGEARSIFNTFLTVTIVAIVVIVLILAGAEFWLARTLRRPLRRIAEAMGRLTAGDTSVSVQADSGRTDEIGALAKASPDTGTA